MAVVDDLLGSKVLVGIAVAAGVVLVAPVVAPALIAVAKPLVKSAIKAGYMFYERSAEMLSEAGEAMEDLVAEAKSEIASSRPGRPAQQAQAEAEPGVEAAPAQESPPPEGAAGAPA